MNARQEVYDGHFYDTMRDYGADSARVVVPLLVDWLAPRSVVDVGCAVGSWLAAFQQAGVAEVLGLDGPEVDPAQLDVPRECFVATDLERPVVLDRSFDVALSLEVAEHLPPECASRFVGDLSRLAPVVVFSAAIPHQGGTHHVNEQWPDYWSSLFATHGLRALDCLRPILWNDERVAWWYRQNLVVYATDEALQAHPALQQLPQWPGDHPARLVHPQRYLEWVDYATDIAAAAWS